MKTLFRILARAGLYAYVLLEVLFISTQSLAQNKFTISGTIKDADTGETLIGATIYVKEKETGTITNAYGFYSLSLPAGAYTFSVSYLGYLSQVQILNLQADQVLDIALSEESLKTEEIVVSAEELDRNVQSLETGVNRLEMLSIKKMPALLGESDLIRSIQLLPGVSTVGEGAGGFNVRGGSIDQNLILIDESPVYNSSHLFGLFSVFNPDAVKDVKLIKGGIPAQYGGRLASILDVRLKEGNNQRFAMSGGVGTVSSRLTLEAPIIKDQSSFIVSGRRSYADIFTGLSADEVMRKNKMYFYDVSAKLNHTIDANNKIFISGYFGRDVFRFGDDFVFDWGNSTGTLRWNHLFSNKLFSNFTLIYSNYNYSLGIPKGSDAFDWRSNIITYSGKADFNYFLNLDNTLNFGAQANHYTINLGKVKPIGESIFNPLDLDTQQAREYAIYLDHENQLSERFSIQYGLRFSYYLLLGEGIFSDYERGANGRGIPINTRQYDKGEVVTSYHQLEPRANIRYQLSDESSLKASYNRTAQYIHLISNSLAAAPTDIWVGSTPNIKPEWADQVSVGYFRNFKDHSIETSVEIYYKSMANQIDYIDGAQTLLNQDLEAELLYGKGRAYGLELFVKKNTGKLNGWISYTLSKTERLVEGINNGNWYAAKFDRPHNLSIVGIYELNKRWSFSANFNYSSGIATTFPDSRYEVGEGGIVVPHNGAGLRNNVRLPAYHRLDLSATLEGKTNPKRKWESSWVFSVYNAYARRNAYSVFFRQNENNPQITEAVRFSVFGTILPSITYNFKF